MSDYDNTREDDYERKLEASNEARDAAMEFHAENWLTAVTQSVEKSQGAFRDVIDHSKSMIEGGRVKRPANSIDVFIEELQNLDFMERAAKILIDFKSGALPRYELDELFDDMAANYAEYKYEQNRED
jgi:hypothetical protein